MADYAEYKDKYPEFALDRIDGVMHLRFHTDGGPFCWSASGHRLLADVLMDINSDPENRVLLLSGTGDFCGSANLETMAGKGWEVLLWEGKRNIWALLDLEIPVIAVVEGRCTIHAENALLSDIVLASPSAVFGDDAHFPRNVVPGDGAHVLWPALLGLNRGRYLLFAEETITAQQAMEAGIVAEILEGEKLMERAWTLARRLALKPSMVNKSTRAALLRPFRNLFNDALDMGFALEVAAYGNGPHRGATPFPKPS